MENNDDIDYWTKYALNLIKKEGLTMPLALGKIKSIGHFQMSSKSVEQLRTNLERFFLEERKLIIDKVKAKLINGK